MSNKKTSNSNLSTEKKITQERFRQGRLIFNFFVGIILGVLLLLDKVPPDTIIPIVRLILSMECPNLVKDADKLNKILVEENNENVEEDNKN